MHKRKSDTGSVSQEPKHKKQKQNAQLGNIHQVLIFLTQDLELHKDRFWEGGFSF